ncbi:MAG: hypothetical protein HY693_00660, partial [Deltaproteobacteria bacterium]|nr:hypothetical protein [Deltaproteobacteria bacterium]
SSNTWIYDLEVYQNFFLAVFKDQQSEETKTFSVFGEGDQIPAKEIKAFVAGKTLVGFNILAYDNLVLAAILHGKNPTPSFARQISNCIIGDKERKPVWMKENQVARELGFSRLPKLGWDSVDLARIGLTKEDRKSGNGILGASLKLVAARLRMPSIESLPYPPDATLTKAESEHVENYCKKDIATTERLYQTLKKSISLRKYLSQKYALNVASDHNAAIAEKVILKEFCRRQNIDDRAIRTLANPVYPAIPVQDILDDTLDLSQNPVVAKVREELQGRTLSGVLEEGFYKYPEIEVPVIINGKKYNVKLGGLHSEDSSAIFRTDETNTLLHVDAASFYPAIMLKLQSYPSQLGPIFLDILREIRDERLAAKEKYKATKEEMAKVTADALKIVINSLFGKAGDKFSKLYDAKNIYRVTVNGELYLLMLIEDLERAGFEVLTSNTDGVVVRVARDRVEEARQILTRWSNTLGFELDSQECKLYARLTVNDYLIAHTGGQTTAKGDLAENTDIGHNANMVVAVKAVQEYLTNYIPIAETIGKANDPYDFMLFRKSKYGLVFEGKPLNEKIARWFLAKAGGKLQVYKGDGGLADINRSLCESVLLCNDISGFSWDALDRGRYIREAQKIVDKLEGRPPERPTPKGRKGKKAKAQVRGQLDLFQNLPDDIDYLDQQGMVLCPTTKKGEGKGRPEGWNTGYPDGDYTRSWDWSDSGYTGAAIVTGPETLVVSVDIDNLQLAYPFLASFLPLRGMVIGHGVNPG